MIAAVTLAEKEERKKKHFVLKTILGYDTLKWIKANAVVRGESQMNVEYQTINFIPPHKGEP